MFLINYLFYYKIFETFFIFEIELFKKNDSHIIPSEWTIQGDFNVWICALAEQLYALKTSHMSKMNPEQFL